MVDRYTFVLNSGKDASTNLDSYTYDVKGTAKSIAFTNCAVNPIIKSTGIVNGEALISNQQIGEINTAQDNSIEKLSANFFEIRKGPYDGEISSTSYSTIVNRIFPSGNATVINNYGINQQKTKSFKIRTYKKSESVQGEKVVGSGGLDMDLDTYDYFVLLNPEITGDDGAVSIRPHFARIKQIVTFDEYGDGFEFEPKYGGPIPKGTNIEIYKGPHKVNDTDVVAVSYGLRGNTNASSGLSDKYDVSNTVSKPTWYFYNDRLNVENQLDYNTKYTLTTCRWFSPFYTIGTGVSATGAITTSSSLYQSSANSIISYSGTDPSIVPGQTLYAYDGISGNRVRLGNVVALNNSSNTITLDTIRVSLPSGSPVGQLGSTIHQTVFLTEREYGTIINDLGRYNQDAVLVDNIHDLADSDTDYDIDNALTNSLGLDARFDPSVWKDAIRNYSRNNSSDGLTGDYNSSHGSYAPAGNNRFLFANLDGAKRHIYYKSAHLKNNIVPTILDARVNNPRNKISQMAKIKTLDHTGIQHLKLKEDASLSVRTSIYTGTLDEYKLPYTATSNTVGGIYQIILNQVENSFDYRNDSFIKVNDIIRIADWVYRVSATSAPSSNEQIITVNKKKHINGSSFATITLLESFTNSEIFVRSWNGGLAGAIPIDTEVVYDSNNFKRITIDGSTISKNNTSLYNTKLSLLEPQFYGHDIPIDYGDSLHKYIKLQSPTKQLYQLNPISFPYYISGKFAIDEEVFSGTIEDIESKNEDGYISYTISGRDSLSKLLSNTVSKNLNHSDDIVYSSLTPVNTATEYNTAQHGADNFKITDSAITVDVYDIVLDNNGLLIGEVEEMNASTKVVTLKDNVINPITSVVKIIELGNENYLSATKALGTNQNHSKYPTDFSAAGEKGILFNDGLKLTSNGGTQTTSELIYTSSTTEGTYQKDKSLGYDMADIRGIVNNKDSDFATKLSLEDAVTITHRSVHTPCSPNYYSIIDINMQKGNNTTLVLAPTFPVVLGSIETNTSDSSYGEASQPYIYMVNRNIPNGGFIHTLTSTHGNYYTPKQSFRYLSLQENDEGAIVETHTGANTATNIYNDNNKTQNIMASTPIYKINLLGAKQTLINDNKTKSNRPIHGSNLLDSNYDEITSGSPILNGIAPKEHYDGTNRLPGFWREWESIDYRTKNYELLALGDIYPESYLRQNNIGKNAYGFENFGILLESNGTVGNTVAHQNYTGNTSETLRSDANYERIEIESATIDTNEMKRFGIMRLVEATFDWHFNPLDYECTPDTKDIAEITHTNYSRFKMITNGANTLTGQTLSTGITPTVGDLIFKSDGMLGAVITSSTGTSANTTTIHADDIVGSSYTGAVVIVTPKHFTVVADPNNGLNDLAVGSSIKFQNVYIALPELEKSYFDFSLLHSIVGSNEYKFDAHNIFIPIIPQTYHDASNANDWNTYKSPYHESHDWTSSSSETYYHPSRIINALGMPTTSSMVWARNDAIQYKVSPLANLYENCHVLFKDMVKCTNGNNAAFTKPTSAALSFAETSTNAMYEAFSEIMANEHLDQVSPNLLIADGNSGDGNAYVLTGTKTKRHIYAKPEGTNRVWSSRDISHEYSDNSNGDLFSAQMFVKPRFNFPSNPNSTTFNFTLDENTTHKWLDFVPNLIGYYLVSEQVMSGEYLPNLDTSKDHVSSGSPKIVMKIVNHTVTTAVTNGETYSKHVFTVDTTLNTTTYGSTFRLMRPSEITFEDTPEYFAVNRMFDTGLKYEGETQNFITGEEILTNDDDTTEDDLVYQEGLYSMYLLLDIDTANTHLERRTVSDAKDLFVDGDSIECYITDGKNSTTKTLSVKEGTNSLRFSYNGKLNGNGIVSFGKIFTVESPSDPKLSRPTKAYIGTTISVGTDTQTAIEEILEENGIDVDSKDKNIVYTNNIVDTTSSTTITCLENIVGIANNDIIYNQDGKLIGKVASTSNKVITLTDIDSDSTVDMYFTPVTNDEIVLYSRKPLITNAKFNENDVFNSINFLASKRGLDYTFVNNKIKIQELESYNNRRKFSLRYKDGKNLVKVDSNKSLFDRANKIIVIGDNVKAVSEIPTNKKTRTIKYVDSNIKNLREAEMKALELLEFHSRPYRKITLTLQKKGLELMKPGDLITLNFPNHDIPPDDYIIFEIENIMSDLSKVTVGTFNKTIAERLAEINLAQDKAFTNIFTKELNQTITSRATFQGTKVSESSLKYTTTGTSGAIIGFE
jgi:hypothetical protein